MSSPDLIEGSHHKEFRILYRDPRVKPEDDIVTISRIPRLNSRIPRINSRIPRIKSRIPRQKSLGILEFLRINLEFLRINLEFLEIASVALLPRNDVGNSRIP